MELHSFVEIYRFLGGGWPRGKPGKKLRSFQPPTTAPKPNLPPFCLQPGLPGCPTFVSIYLDQKNPY